MLRRSATVSLGDDRVGLTQVAPRLFVVLRGLRASIMRLGANALMPVSAYMPQTCISASS